MPNKLCPSPSEALKRIARGAGQSSFITEFNVNIEDMVKIAAHDRAAALSNSRMKVAIVATDEMTQTIVNLYSAEMFESPWESKIFGSMSAAQQWVL